MQTPVAAPYVPNGHAAQKVDPAVDVYVPSWHGTHEDAVALHTPIWPAGHRRHGRQRIEDGEEEVSLTTVMKFAKVFVTA
jgi:hypothetical protein